MSVSHPRPGASAPSLPDVDLPLQRFEAGDVRFVEIFARHGRWGYGPDPARGVGSLADIATAAERLCSPLCDAGSVADSDACAMPRPDRAFDAVLAVACSFHFPSRDAFLLECARLLRPGGRLALSDFVPATAQQALLRRGPINESYQRRDHGQLARRRGGHHPHQRLIEPVGSASRSGDGVSLAGRGSFP